MKTNFENLQSFNIDKLTEWLDEYGVFDHSPWMKWWNKHFCEKCELVIGYMPDFDRECHFSWCELEHKCRFFQDMDDVPSSKDIVKMWLEAEVEDEEIV